MFAEDLTSNFLKNIKKKKRDLKEEKCFFFFEEESWKKI